MENTDGNTSTGKKKPGRPVGSTNKFSIKSRELAEATGILPHEFLLLVVRGEPIKHKVKNPVTGLFEEELIVPKWEDRLDCAKAAAPYYAPKFATVEVIQKVSDDELDAIIKSLAAEAGIGDGTGGEGQEDEGAPDPGSQQAGRRRLDRPTAG